MYRGNHWWRLPLLGVLTLALLLCCGAQGQAQQRSAATIWNSVVDRVNRQLLFGPIPLAEAQGPEESIAQLLNSILVPATETESAYLRGSQTILTGATLPVTCVASQALFVNINTGVVYVCNSTGDGWVGSSGDGGVGDGATILCELDDLSCDVPPAHADVLTWVVDETGTYGRFLAPQTTVLADLSVTTAKLDNLAVTTAKLNDLAVTTAKLATTTVTPGTYGSTTQSIALTIGADGRVTAASNQEISGIPTGSVGPAEIQSTAVTPGVCGDATHVCIVESDQDGRIINQSEVPIEAATVAPDLTLDSLRLTPVAQSGTCVLTSGSVHRITAAGGGTTCTLPDIATATDPGYFEIYNVSANNLSLAPDSGDTINGLASTIGPIVGPLASYTCRVSSATDWRCTMTSLAGYGSPMTTLCAGIAGGTNNSATATNTFVEHTLACAIPSAKLTIGSVLEICSAWHVVTGAVPPALSVRFLADDLVLNSTIAVTPLANLAKNITTCATTVVASVPGTTANLYTSPVGTLDSLITGNSAGGLGQPVVINTSGVVSITQSTRFGTAGTGPNEVTQLYMIVKGSGLAQ